MQELCAAASEESEVWVPGNVAPLVQFASRVRSISATGIDTLGIPCRIPSARLVEELRSFDSIVSWYGSNREEFASALLSIGVQAEFRTALPPATSPLHAVDFFLGHNQATSRYPSLSAIAETGGAPYIAIHPFSGSTHKNWPLTRFRELEPHLPFPVVYCTGPEQPLPTGSSAVQYASLERLASWIRGAALYIGNDSGITHLSAALGVPTIAIFGYSDPRIWAPRGSHVRVVSAGSLVEVSTGAVLDAVRSLLPSRL